MSLMTSPLPAPTHDRVWERQFVFIIGAPRSGTTWLQALVGSHPSVCTSVEMTLFDCYLGPWLKRWEAPEAHYRRGQAGGWQSEFSLWDRYVFDQVAGNLLESLGYDASGWWARSWRDRCRVRACQCLAGLNEYRRRLFRLLAG
jgi:hypothetical protein